MNCKPWFGGDTSWGSLNEAMDIISMLAIILV